MEKIYSHSGWTKWDATLDEFLSMPEARMVSCGLPISVEIQFADCKRTVTQLTQALILKYASEPETYLNQVLPVGATVPSFNTSYERHGNCYDNRGERFDKTN